MATRSGSSNSGNSFVSGATSGQLPNRQPLADEVLDEGGGLGVLEHALIWFSSSGRSRPSAAKASKGSSGMVLQRKYESRLANS